MIKQLIKLANHLDSKGHVKEADCLDEIIKEAAFCSLLPFFSMIACGVDPPSMEDDEVEHIWWTLGEGDKIEAGPAGATTWNGCQFNQEGWGPPNENLCDRKGWFSITWDLNTMNLDPDRSKIRGAGEPDEYSTFEDFVDTGPLIDEATLNAGTYTLYFLVAEKSTRYHFVYDGEVSETNIWTDKTCCNEF